MKTEERLAIVVTIFLLITLVVLWYVKLGGSADQVATPAPQNFSGTLVTFRFLDIGQGDATLIDFPSGEQMLIDCGKDAAILAALGRNLKPFDRTIEYLVVTHPDNDHYGGCIDVLDRFQVKHIWYNGVRKTHDSYWNFFWDKLHAEQAEYVHIQKQGGVHVGSTTIDILYPDHDVAVNPRVPDADKDTGDNDTSIVFVLGYGGSRALFTGDMELPLEQYLFSTASSSLAADILKVGHHGSNSSSGQPFLDTVRPRYATISAGKDNRYGHPTRRVLKRLERIGATVRRTDEDGDITVRMYDDGVEME